MPNQTPDKFYLRECLAGKQIKAICVKVIRNCDLRGLIEKAIPLLHHNWCIIQKTENETKNTDALMSPVTGVVQQWILMGCLVWLFKGDDNENNWIVNCNKRNCYIVSVFLYSWNKLIQTMIVGLRIVEWLRRNGYKRAGTYI